MTIFPRTARRLLGACLLAAVLYPASGLADPCNPQNKIPGCQSQVQAPVPFYGGMGSGWAFYCTGDHPYFWGLGDGILSNYTWDNSCFTGIENLFDENPNNKFDGTFANWCWSQQNLVVTLGCSDRPPPWSGPDDCAAVGEPVSNPGCASSDADTSCSNTNPPVCFKKDRQTCGDGTQYNCTGASAATTWCYKCKFPK